MWSLPFHALAAASALLSLCSPATAQKKGEWFSQLQSCPQSCSASGIDSGNWTLYHDAAKLYSCTQPMLLDMSLHNPVDYPNNTLSLFACSGNNKDGDANCNAPSADANITTTSDTSETATVEVIWSGTGQSQRAGDAVAVAQYASSQTTLLSCELSQRTSTFAYLNGIFIGIWTGEMVDKQTTVNLLDQVVSGLKKNEVQGSLQLSQVCGSNRTSEYTVGVAVAIPESVADLTALAQVQNAVKTWSMGNCVAADPSSSKSSKSTLEVHQLALASSSTRRNVGKRANCKTIVVVSGDSCGSLAKKCGISGADFTRYNPKANLCSKLAVNQHVCCSAGTLPNYAPKPQSNGVCATYLVKKGDTCADIAEFYDITVTQLENWNKKTWGWMGCKDLQAQMKICLSSGDPLMPAPIANAVCGPQVPGTKRPTNGTALALLNQCPLKACCDKWGQCGTTAEFCTQIDSATGAPGTSKAGTNGCISNCGTKIISSSAPAHFRSVAYYEAFNSGRKCLNMDVRSLQGFNYDTVHFAFANISKSFDVDISSLKASFQDFVAMKSNGFRRVLSFGGWSFSTDVDSYPIFRDSVTNANRATFASNVAAFVKKWDLDGVDFDWEYPGAPDIPGIPPGDPGDGGRYLDFLKTLKSKLPSGTTLSIAAPASYWYLKGFPIAEISKVVDYIIYMTYDLHGQWDWNNTWADPGCKKGGCLRSHVNLTETMQSLTLITKAGVASNKVIVGTASYGRSFKMSDKSCTGPSCHFTGPLSGATPGRCTKTAGYISNAEIFELLSAGNGTTHYDKGSDSNIAIYGGNWVSYMTPNTTSSRQSKYKGLNFGGTTNWAVDLQSWMLPFDPLNVLASNVNWEKVPAKSLCNDINRNPSDWWNEAGCDSAWKAAIKYWNSVSPANQKLHGFSNEIASFFGATENQLNMWCNRLNDDNGCSADAAPTCGVQVGPAAYLILTSFTHINSQLWQMYGAIQAASDNVSPSISNMSQVFNPPPSGSDALNLIEEFLQPVFAMAMGPEFEKVLSPLEIGPLPVTNHKSSSSEKVKNATKEAIGNITSQLIGDGWDYIQDNIGTTSSWTDPTATLQQNLKNLTNYWQLGLQGMGNSTFSGTPRAISNLYSMIDHGSFLITPPTPAFTLSQSFQAPIYARLIPAAWSNNAGEGDTIGPQGLFVLDSGDSCSSGSSCSSSVPSHLSAFLTGDTAKNACFCDGGKMYYLALLKGAAELCVAFPVEQCNNQTFSTPPGLDALDGKAWGGLTLKKFITGAVNTYKANGNKNGFKPNYNNPKIMTDYISGDITAPGGVAIPVCSAQEAFDNWYAESTSKKNFPCN